MYSKCTAGERICVFANLLKYSFNATNKVQFMFFKNVRDGQFNTHTCFDFKSTSTHILVSVEKNMQRHQTISVLQNVHMTNRHKAQPSPSRFSMFSLENVSKKLI